MQNAFKDHIALANRQKSEKLQQNRMEKWK